MTRPAIIINELDAERIDRLLEQPAFANSPVADALNEELDRAHGKNDEVDGDRRARRSLRPACRKGVISAIHIVHAAWSPMPNRIADPVIAATSGCRRRAARVRAP